MFNPGSEQTIVVGAKTYRLGRLTIAVLRAFKEWVALQVGDPFDLADRYLDRVPPDEAKRLIAEASDLRDQLRFFSLGTPIAARLLATEEGATKLIHLLLTAKDGKATEEDAMALALHISGEEMAKVLAKAQGGAPSSGESDPNADRGAGPASGGETSTGP